VTVGHTVWGQEAITMRAKAIAAIAVQLWQRPSVPAPSTSEVQDAELDLDPEEEAVPFTSSVDEEDEARE
jgi:hypothetical protein